MNTETKKYLTCAETAKLIRKELKQSFPGQKFSVRKSSSGSSVRVSWTDGPTTKEVEKITKKFEGKDFDCMIDLAYYVSHWMLPNGDVVLAHSPGTESSRGTHPEIKNEKPHPDAVMVSLGADYIFASREYSIEGLKQIAAQALAKLNRFVNSHIPDFEIDYSEYGGAFITTNDWSPVISGGHQDIRDWIIAEAEETSFYDAPQTDPKPEPDKETVQSPEPPQPEEPQVEVIDDELLADAPLPEPEAGEPSPLEKMVRYLLTKNSPGDVLTTITNSGIETAEALQLMMQCLS